MESNLNLEDTELRLGLPGTEAVSCTGTALGSKRASSDTDAAAPDTKEQVVGWPPIRSYRRNNSFHRHESSGGGMYVKVGMDGAPYLRKIDIKGYEGYADLLKAMECMFKFEFLMTMGEYSLEKEGYKGSEFVPTYEDKDGDWMLLGDVPWEMFVSSCKRLRVVKRSEAKGLGCDI